MSRQTNGLQRMAEKVSDGHFCACGEAVIATEFSAAAMPAARWSAGASARDRALAGT
jgi:hypothetical protein